MPSLSLSLPLPLPLSPALSLSLSLSGGGEMGCAASRLDNEDTVRRCKERRRLMKEIVYSRHHLASAHADYLSALNLTGSALTRFAAGEPLSVSEQTPPVLLHHHHSAPSAVSSIPPPTPQSSIPPPPQPPLYSPSITNSKLPHILSDSSVPSTPSAPSAAKKHSNRFPSAAAGATNAFNSTFATTPSQASSVWDWENFYPPSPPGSDFFNQLKAEKKEEESDEEMEENHQPNLQHHLPHEDDDDECHDFRHDQCSSSTSSSTKSEYNEEDEEERYSRSEGMATRSDIGGSSSVDIGGRVRPVASEIGSSTAAGKSLLRERSDFGSSSAGWNTRDDSSSATGNLKLVVRHRDLVEIVASLEEYFKLAAAAGEPVSDLLEIGRAQFERSFRQLKKTVYHSNSVMSALSSSLSSKPPLAIRYRLDAGALGECAGEKSHSSTLERLLAWEKKLYEEVKAREGVKIEHEKKLSALQSQEYRGKEDAKLDKTKASINKLQSLIVVTSQAVSTTSSAITRVRDNELAPQLVDLCCATLAMWRSVNKYHEIQNDIVQQVRGLVQRSQLSAQSTSDLHRVATRDLEAAVSSWHSSFIRLVKYHREYLRSLYGWLKLSLLPVSSDGPQNTHSSPVAIELTAFSDEWKQALDRLPDTVASEAIKSFVNVVHVISTKQEEEMKAKRRAEACSKELEKKSTSLRAIERKYYQSYSMVGIGIHGAEHAREGDSFDSRDPLAEKKSEIAVCRRKVEEEMLRHAKAVEVTRSMTLNNIQTGLPGVFQAMTGFSGLFTEALQGVCRRAGSVN
ncbi:hypothetical protein AXF42_Ash006042 [Apostasia shenzhenica]|uniref:DUF632 domain-containing protein n=1 Tax=Apostasia shenzhenica TaxID=1088818 RepID=A0A2I0B038_9ASPA|nr:hypothetical protein AXF42_Ash006042 [Apostasia shenzhenica]